MYAAPLFSFSLSASSLLRKSATLLLTGDLLLLLPPPPPPPNSEELEATRWSLDLKPPPALRCSCGEERDRDGEIAAFAAEAEDGTAAGLERLTARGGREVVVVAVVVVVVVVLLPML